MQEMLSLMPWIWTGIAAITLIIQLFTFDVDALWFTVGALVALILSLFDIHIAIQLSSFILITVFLLFTAGRFIKKKMMRKRIIEKE